ncbi:hypothetical protein L5515_009660 [Caenorhabditis briggsae]|uniref:Uncharacterized protein n=1 Tax=Caenorhabditis briggsae TaxID=6238 RepID=A0AAE9F414_CAEBR|nr:hypothetical protein L5515_009660 [Caenorhabditis briggsae]
MVPRKLIKVTKSSTVIDFDRRAPRLPSSPHRQFGFETAMPSIDSVAPRPWTERERVACALSEHSKEFDEPRMKAVHVEDTVKVRNHLKEAGSPRISNSGCQPRAKHTESPS